MRRKVDCHLQVFRKLHLVSKLHYLSSVLPDFQSFQIRACTYSLKFECIPLWTDNNDDRVLLRPKVSCQICDHLLARVTPYTFEWRKRQIVLCLPLLASLEPALLAVSQVIKHFLSFFIELLLRLCNLEQVSLTDLDCWQGLRLSHDCSQTV